MPTCYLSFRGGKNIVFISFVAFILTGASCRQANKENYAHPAYFDTIFRMAEHINSTNPAHSLAFIDSAFTAFGHPGIKDLYRKYSFASSYFIEVNTRYPIYLDAARYTRQAVQEISYCTESYGKFKLLQSKLDDAGIYYSKCKMPDSALYYFKAALSYLLQGENKFPHIANSGQFIVMPKEWYMAIWVMLIIKKATRLQQKDYN